MLLQIDLCQRHYSAWPEPIHWENAGGKPLPKVRLYPPCWHSCFWVAGGIPAGAPMEMWSWCPARLLLPCPHLAPAVPRAPGKSGIGYEAPGLGILLNVIKSTSCPAAGSPAGKLSRCHLGQPHPQPTAWLTLIRRAAAATGKLLHGLRTDRRLRIDVPCRGMWDLSCLCNLTYAVIKSCFGIKEQCFEGGWWVWVWFFICWWNGLSVGFSFVQN